jgi:hypothetical protein
MSEAMTATHKATMNLRFIEREVCVGQPIDLQPIYERRRVLQQMFVPKDWSAGLNEFWQDVPFVEGDFSNEGSHVGG